MEPNIWTFDPTDIANLEAKGEIGPVVNGTRLILRSLMGIPPVVVYSDELVPVPIMLRGRECLQFIGFTSQTAANLWRRWIEKGIASQEDFLAFACSDIRHAGQDTDSYDDMDWFNCALSYGVCSQFIDTIMNASFKKFKLTKSAKFCTLQLLENNYRILLRAQEASTARAKLHLKQSACYKQS